MSCTIFGHSGISVGNQLLVDRGGFGKVQSFHRHLRGGTARDAQRRDACQRGRRGPVAGRALYADRHACRRAQHATSQPMPLHGEAPDQEPNDTWLERFPNAASVHARPTAYRRGQKAHRHELAGGKIDHQIIEIAPIHAAQKRSSLKMNPPSIDKWVRRAFVHLHAAENKRYSQSMTPVEFEGQTVEDELQRVL